MAWSSVSPSPLLISENNIRYRQTKILSKIENVEKNVSETCNLCVIVKDQILDYEDEPQLSRTQNNFRRIYIASELILGICSMHDQIVDFAFTKIINDLLHLDKYKIISHKISHKTNANLKKEKYFTREAHAKLLKSLGDEKKEDTTRIESALEGRAGAEEELEIAHPNSIHTVNILKEIPLDDAGQILVEDSLVDSHLFNLMGDMSEVRIEPQVEASNLNIHSRTMLNEISLQPSEISIKGPFDQQLMEEDINQILDSSVKIARPHIRITGLSENLLESISNIPDAECSQVEILPSLTKDIGSQIHPEKGTEEWSLSTLEPVEISKKKCPRMKTDKLTIIPNYSIRAVELNKNIEIQRVQVFEGSPRILQSMSSEYLMKTSAFKRFLSQNVRSSMLNRLFKRNLTTEKRPVESFVPPNAQKRTVEPKVTERKSELQERSQQIPQELIEEVGEKVGMHSAAVESGVLAELASEKTQPNISVNGSPKRQSLMGLSMSRIASPIIQPPDKEKINGSAPMPSPRIQQLQGTTLEPTKHSPPRFYSTKKKPPRAEFHEFNYVRGKLHYYWSLFERQGRGKSITMREFILFEEDGNFANYLTILRVVDKLSIQRELFLDYKNGEVLIEPFEMPYISKDQLLFQGKEQIV